MRFHVLQQIFLCILLPSVIQLTVTASEQPQAIFSTSNIEPWGFQNDNEELDGLLIKVAELLTEETGIKVSNHLRPYPRVIHEIKNGSVDFAIMFNSDQAKEIGISVGHVVDTKILLIGLSETVEISNLNELSGHRVGFLRGSKYGTEFDNNDKMKKVSLDSMEQGIKMLLKNSIDVVASAEQTFYFTLKKLEISTDKVRPIMVINKSSGDLYFSKASTNKHLIEPFKEALKKLNKNGKLVDIFHNNDFMPK